MSSTNDIPSTSNDHQANTDSDNTDPSPTNNTPSDNQNDINSPDEDEALIANQILQESLTFKSQADSEIKNNDYQSAYKHYQTASQGVRAIKIKKVFNKEKIDELNKTIFIPSNLNLSFIDIKNKDYNNCINNTTNVLEIEPDNTKALYRRCLSFINKNDFINAKEDLDKLGILLSDNTELKMLRDLYKENKEKFQSGEGAKYKKMFKNYGKAGNADSFNATGGLNEKIRKSKNEGRWGWIWRYLLCCCKKRKSK